MCIVSFINLCAYFNHNNFNIGRILNLQVGTIIFNLTQFYRTSPARIFNFYVHCPSPLTPFHISFTHDIGDLSASHSSNQKGANEKKSYGPAIKSPPWAIHLSFTLLWKITLWKWGEVKFRVYRLFECRAAQ